MAILVLGLPRSGTDSLRTALHTLGYSPIWHGFEMAMNRQDEGLTWCRLLEAKWNISQTPTPNPSDTAYLHTFNWDSLLGDCAVLMDMPPAIFHAELLDFYPDAHVIVSRRPNDDMHAWHRSLVAAANATVRGPLGWLLWGLGWFDTRLFWWYRAVAVWSLNLHLGNGDFERYGLERGEKHYVDLARKLERDGRAYLDWDVTDGWGPLCAYLGREVPEGQEFPWKNRSGDEFKKNADRAIAGMLLRAMGKVVGFFAGVGLGWWLHR